MLGAPPPTGGLDQSHRCCDGGGRVVLEPEGQREVEQDLGIRLAVDGRVQRRVDVEHQIAFDPVEVVDEAVVHEQPAAAAERMAVRLLHRRAARRADVGKEQWRPHVCGELAQVRVAPRRLDAAEDRGALFRAVPATPNPSPFVVSAPSRECRLCSTSECAGA